MLPCPRRVGDAEFAALVLPPFRFGLTLLEIEDTGVLSNSSSGIEYSVCCPPGRIGKTGSTTLWAGSLW